ncbi:hypothetical protein, partial [Serratia marcescens]|uniref:hypothetical protein n=1 Tax=Serratia marcescens TaxID=615 RepID=UPI00196754EA
TKVKVLTSSLNHVIEYLLTPGNENKMNELIKKTDKSWQFPPNFSLPNPPYHFERFGIWYANRHSPYSA